MTAVDPLVAELRALRLKAGLTQGAVAAAAGTSQRYLCNVEGGRQQPSVPWLRRLGQALGVQPGWLPLAYETAPAVPEIAAGNGATPQDGRELSSVAPASDPAPLSAVAGSDVAPKSPADAAATSGVLADGGSASSAASTANDPWATCACGHLWVQHDVAEYRGDGSEMCCVEGCAQNGCPGNDCPCGHSWGRHIFGRLPDSELCCVADCDKTRCPGAAVSLISTPGKPAVEGYSNLHDVPPTLNPDAIRDAYGLGPDPSVALIAFDDALAEPCDCDAHNEIRRQMQDPEFAAAWLRTRLRQEAAGRTLDVAERTVEKARADRVKIVADAIRKESTSPHRSPK